MVILIVAAGLTLTPPRPDDGDDDRSRRHATRHDRRDPDDDDGDRRNRLKVPAARIPDPLPTPTRVSPTVLSPGAPVDSAPVPSSTAQSPVRPQHDADDDDDEQRAPESEITVIARRLDASRMAIEPTLGAAIYSLTNDAVESRPGGETGRLGSVLVQMPGVARDARGSLVVRGAAGGVQYRINNLILPEGAGDIGELLSARLAARTELISGAVPAQYGLAPGGVVAITTKNGHYLAGGQAELYGGAHGTIEPAVEWSHSAGPTGLFFTGSVRQSGLGLPAPDASGQPLHDSTGEIEGFAFVDHVLDAASRVSLIAGSVNERQQVPALAVIGVAGAERRYGSIDGHHHYALGAYQRSDGPFALQASVSALVATRAVVPDQALRLTVDGRSFAQHDRRRAFATQIEASYTAGAGHVLRAGLVAGTDRLDRAEQVATLVTTTNRLLAGARENLSLFAQDEWTLRQGLVANLGLRADWVGRTDGRMHLQPRAALAWTSGAGFSAHVHYARSILTVPLDDVISELSPPSHVEHDRLFGAGVEQRIGGLTIGVDLYDRRARDFIATRWRRDAPVGEAFSYARAHLHGAEFIVTYARGPVTLWSNMALAKATARGISGGANELDATQLAYVISHRVAIDSDQRLTLSTGGSYRFGPILVSASLLAGSGTPRTAPGARRTVRAARLMPPPMWPSLGTCNSSNGSRPTCASRCAT